MKAITNYPIVESVRNTEPFRTPQNIVLKLLIFALVFTITSTLQSIPMLFYFMPKLYGWIGEQIEMYPDGMIPDDALMEFINGMMMDPTLTQIMLFSTALVTIGCLIHCRYIEGRPLSTIGFDRKGAGKQYLLGLGVGFVMFSAVVGLTWAFGGISPLGMANGSVLGVLLAFVGFGIQGMSEEVLCRGYLMTTIMRHQKPWVAVAVNAVIFALLHGSNNGISILALVNLTLCGVMFSLYMLRTNNLWGACAIHSIWNFVQGNFYGLPVSGIDSGDSVFRFALNTGHDVVNGGAFGLEAGLPCTIVLSAVILVLLFVPFGKNSEKAEASA